MNEKSKELKKKFREAYLNESIGGNAGENCAGVNAIIDKTGKIIGFSNYAEDYKGYEIATIKLDFKHIFEAVQKKKKIDYTVPYVREILYNGINKRQITDKIKKQLREMGYREK